MSHDVVVMAAIVVPRVVLRLLSLCRIWCCGCCRRAMRGVVGAVVGLRYVVVVVAMPCAVSQSLLSHHVVLSSRSRLSCHMWCRGHGCCAVWCYGHGGCHHAVWCHSCGHHRGGIVIVVSGCTVVGPGGGGQPCIRWQGW